MSTASHSLQKLLAGENLAEAEAADLMRSLADETLPPAVAAGVLVALRAKGETPTVRGFRRRPRELALPFPLPADLHSADSVGTGGDSSGSFNLSTGTGLLAAACGVPVVSMATVRCPSKSGSADV